MTNESRHDGQRHIDDGDWANRARKLVLISKASAWSDEVETAYVNLCGAIMEAMDSENCFLHLLTYAGDAMVRYGVGSDADPSVSEWGEVLPLSTGRAKWLVENISPIVMDYEHPHEDDQVSTGSRLGYKSAVSFPVFLDDRVFGMCSLSFRQRLLWDEGDAQFVREIGEVVGVAVNRIRTAHRHSELRLLEERQRLSSEIHDNVSALVGSISLHAGAALVSYEEGNMHDVEESLEQLEDVCGKTMRVFRDEMLSLRVPLENTDDWLASVKNILTNYEREWGLRITLEVDAVNDPITVNVQTSLQLSRILNECLSNVTRHAQATEITVGIRESHRDLRLSVEDNGRGFDPDAIAPDRLGLKIMRERAAIIGGKVSIRSIPGAGTMVEVRVPHIGGPDLS